MKRSNYLLKIESPCPESWAEMMPTDSGRFCANCAKNVIDFTNLTDDQVLSILKKSDGNLCGRFEESQINRYLVSSIERSNQSHLYKFFAGLFLLTAVNRAPAKTRIDNEVVVRQGYNPNSWSKVPFISTPKRNSADSTGSVFKGSVVDSLSGTPLNGALIQLKGENIQTFTNQEGTFELTIPTNLLNKENTFVISFIGFEARSITVNTENFQDEKTIVLGEDILLQMESVVMGDFICRQRKWWQFWKKKHLH